MSLNKLDQKLSYSVFIIGSKNNQNKRDASKNKFNQFDACYIDHPKKFKAPKSNNLIKSKSHKF